MINKVKKYLRNIALGASLSTGLLTGCMLGIKGYECKKNDLTVIIMETGRYTQMSVLSENPDKESKDNELLQISAKDYNKDGHFDELEKGKTIDEKNSALANFKSVDSLYKKIVYDTAYPGLFSFWAPRLGTNRVDTIVFKYGNVYGLTDLSTNGNYDMINYVGNSPNSFGTTLREGYEKELKEFFGSVSIPSGPHTRVIDSTSFQRDISLILKPD